MRILVYYSKGREYQDLNNILKAEGHHPLILWADNFKEVNDEFGDAYYVTSDVEGSIQARIGKHMEKLEIPILTLQQDDEVSPQSKATSDTSENEDWTVESITVYIAELETALVEAKEIQAKMLTERKEELRKKDEADAILAKEAADAAKVKADAEKAEAEQAKALANKEAKESAEAQAEADRLAKEAEEAAALVKDQKVNDADATTENPVPKAPGLTIEQLRAELDLLGVKYTQRNTKPELEALLKEALDANNGE